MKKTDPNILKRLLNRYRLWNTKRQIKILNTMVKYSFDEALRLANRKRDIMNHKVWVVAGNGEFLVFARYQLKTLQQSKLIDKHTSSLELESKASYIAYPVTATDSSRKGLIRKFIGDEAKTNIKVSR